MCNLTHFILITLTDHSSLFTYKRNGPQLQSNCLFRQRSKCSADHNLGKLGHTPPLPSVCVTCDCFLGSERSEPPCFDELRNAASSVTSFHRLCVFIFALLWQGLKLLWPVVRFAICETKSQQKLQSAPLKTTWSRHRQLGPDTHILHVLSTTIKMLGSRLRIGLQNAPRKDWRPFCIVMLS